MKLRLVAILGILFYAITLRAQYGDKGIEHAISFKPGFHQIKEEFNYGLVNNGLFLAGEYALFYPSGRNCFIYEAELGFGMNYRQGLGMIWALKPFELLYGFRINDNPDLSITLGPYLSGYYMWQLYPELQSGHMFWISSYELGPRIMISLPVKGRTLHFSFSNSVASLNSRPEMGKEEYFYSLTFSDFVRNPHSNMTLGSVNVYNHFDVKLDWSDPEKRFSLGYEFEYMGYMDTPKFSYMSHSLNLKWELRNKKLNR